MAQASQIDLLATLEATNDSAVVDPGIAARMRAVENDLIGKTSGIEAFARKVGEVIRTAIDHIIDAPTLYRYAIEDLDNEERATIGKRIERQLLFEFGLPRGKRFGVILGGEEVDVKTSVGRQWILSADSFDRFSLLVTYDELAAVFSLGLGYARRRSDGSQQGPSGDVAEIRWIVDRYPYPANFLAHLPREQLTKIIAPRSGMKRVQELLRTVVGTPIPRHAICSVANQNDPLRRIRKNGGGRDKVWSEGLMVLTGTYEGDRAVIRAVLGRDLKMDDTLTLSVTDPRLTPELIAHYKSQHSLTKKQLTKRSNQ